MRFKDRKDERNGKIIIYGTRMNKKGHNKKICPFYRLYTVEQKNLLQGISMEN